MAIGRGPHQFRRLLDRASATGYTAAMADTTWTTAPTLDDIEAMAIEAFETIPPALRAHVGDVVITVVDFPDDGIVAEMELETPFDLLGLYSGVHIGHKDSGYTPSDVDRIFLFRRALLDYWCETGEELRHLVRHVLIHEVGHHFGLSDDDMEAIEATVDD
jgi:predicted Zn-dependent protease with MMP-like domain